MESVTKMLIRARESVAFTRGWTNDDRVRAHHRCVGVVAWGAYNVWAITWLDGERHRFRADQRINAAR